MDVTTTPFTWYSWNGSQYAIDPIGQVISVFGRVGAVTAEAGDYNCGLITNCGMAPGSGWYGMVTASQQTGDVTVSIKVVGGTLPESSYFLVDSEWEHFAAYTALSGDNYTLTGVTRAQFTSNAATHSSGAAVSGMQQILSASNEPPFAWIGGTAGQSFMAIACPSGGNLNAEIEFESGCALSGGFFIYNDHTFVASAEGQNLISGSLAVGEPAFTPNSPDQTYSISHTAQVLESGYPNEVTAR